MTPCRFLLYRDQPRPGRLENGLAVQPGKPTLEGVIFSDGTTILQWCTRITSTSVFGSFALAMAAHGHPDAGTRIEWLDRPPFCWERRTEGTCGQAHQVACRPCSFGYHCGRHREGCHQACKQLPASTPGAPQLGGAQGAG